MNKIKIMIESYLSAPSTIKTQKLKWGYFVGGFIGILLLTIFYYLSGYVGDKIFIKLSTYFEIQKYTGALKWIIITFIRVLMISIQYFFFKTILLGILSPFFSYISEKVEKYEDNIDYNFSLKQNIYFVFRGIRIASKSFVKEILYTLAILLLGFIPVVNISIPILIFIVQSYFISYNFVDYTLERRKFSTKESSDFMKENKIAFVIGGGIFTILYFIPVLGIIVAPIIGIVAFTTTTLKILKDKK
ncbi:MAG: EI24 domain-containing protein [Fusobacteriaceae bacterium]